ncbi:hypothetical protein J2Z31_000780 [Sinorhizobium kostiense]|uniref:Uncharacterized protein n=1 Tax=Sinorhizobium kostiense TaxID=76747 RepID=A0ABS4QUG7_9HYPH|nr:hypothetical protein [Sinorhizobium kostiense]MBP2234290.1 hypothetical protein [Sinorhizobium kostiense]
MAHSGAVIHASFLINSSASQMKALWTGSYALTALAWWFCGHVAAAGLQKNAAGRVIGLEHLFIKPM